MLRLNSRYRFIIIIFILISLLSCNNQANKLTWTSINVSNNRQGDAHLICKNNKCYLIDTGEDEQSKTYLLPALYKRGVSNIEGVIITHPHFDHYGGTATLIDSNISVKHIYMNMPTKEQMEKEYWGGRYRDLVYIKNLAKKNNIPVSAINIGDMYVFDKSSYMKVLYVYDGIHTPVGKTDINDMSAIIMIYDDRNRFLLTGDLNKKLGAYIAKNPAIIKADILKAPHHGVEGCAPNSFFEAVSPKALIVPTTKGLWCSKRAKRIRDLSDKYNYKTYVNGIQGDITVVSYKNKYDIIMQNNTKNLCTNKGD